MKRGISVIICCYNSATRLPETLKHLIDQQVSGFDWELILVDNASTDSTAKVSAEILTNSVLNGRFKIVTEPNPGLSNARNKGYETSEYSYLLFCDDDNWMKSDYLQISFDTMESRPTIGILGGYGEAVFEGEKPFWFDEYQINFAVGEQGTTDATGMAKCVSVYGAGLVIRKEIFNLLYKVDFKSLLSDRKGSQLMSGGDTELCYVAGFLGYEVWYNKRMQFKHLMTKGRMNWAYLKNLYFGFGRMNIYLHAYTYFKSNSEMPGKGLKYPLWLDMYIHKLKGLVKYLPKVIFKLGKTGDAEVLRYHAMRGELYELRSLKEKYNEVLASIASFKERVNAGVEKK